MFTGLVQAVGRADFVTASQLRLWCPELLVGMEVGDSVAVDGLCLTVTQVLADGFLADVSPETLSRSTLGQHSAGRRVNLEPSLRVGDKIGGHFVSGHIDGVGQVSEVVEVENAWVMSFRVPGSVARYVVEKGSIAINGISLTIAALQEEGSWFEVAVIPQTYHNTTLAQLQPGDPVNVEGDILGKYVEKLLRRDSEVSLEFLAEHGYA